MEVVNMSERTHYIAMGGTYGCLPDNCSALEKMSAAVETLTNIYELSQRQQRDLRKFGYSNLKHDQGGDYCEISECQCREPWVHSDQDRPEDWPEYVEESEVSE